MFFASNVDRQWHASSRPSHDLRTLFLGHVMVLACVEGCQVPVGWLTEASYSLQVILEAVSGGYTSGKCFV